MPKLIFDNKDQSVVQYLHAKVKEGSSLSFVSAYFTMYAYEALRERLDCIEKLRLILGAPNQNTAQQHQAYQIDDHQIALTEAITQSKTAKECVQWLKDKVEVKSAAQSNLIHCKLYHIVSKSGETQDALVGSSNFTSNGLGIGDSANYELNVEIDSKQGVEDLLHWFNAIWNDESKVRDIKSTLIEKLENLYKIHSPERIYLKTLHSIFEKNIADPDIEDIEENKVFTQTKIWSMLYPFQKDGVKLALHKLEKYNGCILADSVGLGKTYTALGVAQYYITKKKPNILVLCPKKLENNWKAFGKTHKDNVFFDDRLYIDVKAHTDLTLPKYKDYAWGIYDLIILDESHNFRNATASRKDKKGNIIMSRYDALFDILKNGSRQPKMLMLSATPINTGLGDLKNQLNFITLGNKEAFAQNVSIQNIDSLFKSATKKFVEWSKQGNQNKQALLARLDANFFSLLDGLTLARSRKQIESHYGTHNALVFPTRSKPKNFYPAIDTQNSFPDYKGLSDEIHGYSLALYNPSKHLQEGKEEKYARTGAIQQFTQKDREHYLIGMMKVGFLKRLESSIHSFTTSMENILRNIDKTLDSIDRFKATRKDDGFESDLTDYDNEDMVQYEVGKKFTYALADLNVDAWKNALLLDRVKIESLYNKAKVIDAQRDNKLRELKDFIAHKAQQKNKKVLVFTSYADTARYLFENLKAHAKALNVNIGLVTGQTPYTDYTETLNTFAPKAKGCALTGSKRELDILIATDCISEGQNLQDCDCVVNYDIHWNPVRLIQRFGRIDRIGSENAKIRMVNFWATPDLDVYLNLKSRVESRMVLVDIAATSDENILIDDIKSTAQTEISIRDKQIKEMLEGKFDIEDSEIRLSDFSLGAFRDDLLAYLKKNQQDIASLPNGLFAVCPKERVAAKKPKSTSNATRANSASAVFSSEQGFLFCLKQKKEGKGNTHNPIHPFHLVFVNLAGQVTSTTSDVRTTLETMRSLCLGRSEPDEALHESFSMFKQDSIDTVNKLLQSVLASIEGDLKTALVSSLQNSRNTLILRQEDQAKNENDFELITWLIVR